MSSTRMAGAGGVIADLLKRVAALEQAVAQVPPPSEATQPNYLTIAANGTVGATFTGIINAQGLALPMSLVPTPPAVNEIRWLRPSDGAAPVTLAGIEQGGVDQFSAVAQAIAPAISGQVALTAENQSGSQSAQLLLSGTPTGASGQLTSGADTLQVDHGQDAVTASTSAAAATILKAGGLSTFLQAPDATRRWQINAGSGSVTWPGGTQVSNQTTVNAGIPLGTNGGGIIVTSVDQATALSNFVFHASYAGSGGNWTVNAYNTTGNPGAGTTGIFYWLVCGY